MLRSRYSVTWITKILDLEVLDISCAGARVRGPETRRVNSTNGMRGLSCMGSRNDLVMSQIDLPVGVAVWLKRRGVCSLDLEDMIGYGNLGLVKAGQTWNESLGASFKTHAWNQIVYAILNGARAFTKSRKKIRPKTVSIDNLEGRLTDKLADNRPGVLGDFLEREKDDLLHASVSNAVSGLPDRERSIIRAVYFEGKDYGEAAAAMGVSRATVQKACRKALRMLRYAIRR
jgi:RNA polymerase sigma factor (sigma-70 family)